MYMFLLQNYRFAYRLIMTEATEIKLFGDWTLEDVEINDISLVDYLAVKGKEAVFLQYF